MADASAALEAVLETFRQDAADYCVHGVAVPDAGCEECIRLYRATQEDPV